MPPVRVTHLPIRTKLATAVCLLVTVLVGGVALGVERAQRRAIVEQGRRQAAALGSNAAALSASALLAYDYLRLRQIASRLEEEENVVYAIILDREGKVAVHSSHGELEETVLEDPVSLRAAAASRVVVQETVLPDTGESLYDVAAPVYSRESPGKWGTVRVGVSLEAMRRALARTRLMVILLGLAAIALGGIGARLLARWITAPITPLLKGAAETGKGNLDWKIPPGAEDEFGTLARSFNEMTQNLRSGRLDLESAHRELEDRYREISFLKEYNDSMLKSMNSGVFTLDLKARLATCNDATLHILGRSAGELLGKPCTFLFPECPELAHSFRSLLRREDKEVQVTRVRYLHPDGKVLFLEMTAVGLKEESGTPLGVLGMLRDRTHRRELEGRLRRADRLAVLGTIAAGIAHEIKNPLTCLRTFTQLLPRKFGDPVFRKKFAEIVPHELDRINLLVEDLMELARPAPMRLRPGNVHVLIERTLKTHEELMDAQGIQYRFRPAPHPRVLLIDPEHLYRALTNLVLNAIQAMPRGGVLDLRTGTEPIPRRGRAEPHFVISVRDTGAGIPADKLGDLFTPFFTTKSRGTGLGLAITHKIVEGHGGQIRVESEVGKGTRFSLALPLNRSVSGISTASRKVGAGPLTLD